MEAKKYFLRAESANREEPRLPLTIFGYDFCYFFVGMIVFSFLGFCTENAAKIVDAQIFDCRHQILPFLFAYGLALLAIYATIGTPDDLRFFNIRIFKQKTKSKKVLSHLIYIAIICALIFGGEIAVGMVYEKVAGVVLWDYSGIPTHVTRYTSIITTVLLGGGVYLLMNFTFRPMMRLIEKMGTRAAIIIDCTLGALIVADFLLMIIYTFVTGAAPYFWAVSW